MSVTGNRAGKTQISPSLLKSIEHSDSRTSCLLGVSTPLFHLTQERLGFFKWKKQLNTKCNIFKKSPFFRHEKFSRRLPSRSPAIKCNVSPLLLIIILITLDRKAAVVNVRAHFGSPSDRWETHRAILRRHCDSELIANYDVKRDLNILPRRIYSACHSLRLYGRTNKNHLAPPRHLQEFQKLKLLASVPSVWYGGNWEGPPN